MFNRGVSYLVVGGICVIEGGVYDLLDGIESVQYPLNRIEILPSTVEVFQVQLHPGNSYRGVDKGVLGIRAVDLLRDILQEHEAFFVVYILRVRSGRQE